VDHETLERAAAALRAGRLPDAQAWELDEAVQLLADGLARPDGATAAEAQAALKALIGGTRYKQTAQLAKAWTEQHGFHPTITKHHAQALINLAIDVGALDVPEALLNVNLAKAAHETLEYQGLLARVAKQRFVVTGSPDELMTATDRYFTVYETDARPYWHGINAVALRAREQAMGLHRPGMQRADALAKQVLDQVKPLYQTRQDDPWIPATVSEAALALGDCDTAELWVYRFLEHPYLTAFEIESFERQIREVWRGSAARPGGGCADRLAALLGRQLALKYQKVSLSASDVGSTREQLDRDPSGFEKNFSGQFGFSVSAVQGMLDRSASIGCVCNVSGERLGTGFLIPGQSLAARFGSEPVFVTNAHVLGDKTPKAIRRENAQVIFEVESAAAKKSIFYPVDEILFSSAPGDMGVSDKDRLDVTVARLKGLPAGLSGLAVAPELPIVDAKTRAYVIGYPRGGGLQVSLHDSALIDIDDEQRLIHYRTPTDPGSSGSPVFNAAWDVIGLHHAGSSEVPRLRGKGTYQANEAIALAAIHAAIPPA
jgi:V8-like Glu-specific endopeptidase